jgi:crotonobetainyl-CoA:carnitine CoA-transferase CaiB-like acyl-CoA transferase
MSNHLDGFRILESAVLLNGDTVGMHLGDLGADVIKVESPGTGDYLRDMLGQITPRQSPAHLQVNKNKRSIAIDLRSDAGREVFWDLQGSADAFIDGFAGGAMDRLGVGYDSQRERNPNLVYCQYTGFGRQGPYSAIPTHGQMMNAEAASITLERHDDGFVRGAQNRELMGGTSGGGDGTAAGAIHAAFHVVAALLRRERTGQGCFLDVSAADAVIAQGWIGAVYGWNYDRLTDHIGLREPGSELLTGAKYQFYETADDRYILFCCIEPKFWTRFCELVERPDLIERVTEAGAVDFGRNDDALRHELQSIFHNRTMAEWIGVADQHRLPIGPAHQGVASLRDDPHIAKRQILLEGEHPVAGPFTYVGSPVITDHEPSAEPSPAPGVGQHTREILTQIGYDEAKIDRLANDGAVQVG